MDLGENIGSEENKIRPVVVIQSNAYNFKSPVFTVAIISSSDFNDSRYSNSDYWDIINLKMRMEFRRIFVGQLI